MQSKKIVIPCVFAALMITLFLVFGDYNKKVKENLEARESIQPLRD
jgi:hypothetical protein